MGMLGNFGGSDGGGWDNLGMLGSALLSQSSPFAGVNIGNAFLQAAALQRQAQEDAIKRQLMQQQIESGGIDIQQKKQTIQDQEDMRRLMQGGAPSAAQTGPQLPQVGQNFVGANPSYQPQGQPQALPGGKGISIGAPQSASKSALFDQFSAKAEQLEKLGTPPAIAQAKSYRELAEKYRPKLKDEQVRLDPKTNQPVVVRNYEDGTTEISPYSPTAKVNYINTGGQQTGINEYTGKPNGATIANSISPDSALGANVTMRGQNLADLRDRARLAFDTGFGAKQFGFQNPNVPGVIPNMSPAAANQVASDFGKKRAETVEQAQVDLPGAIAQTKQTVKLIDDLVAHPGFSTTVGAKGPTGALASFGYGIPGTDAQDFKVRLDQLKGQAFLQAYQTLKGGGSISNAEDTKATQAMNRMQTSQSEVEFKRAAQEFKDVLQAGLSRAEQKAANNISSGWSIRAIP